MNRVMDPSIFIFSLLTYFLARRAEKASIVFWKPEIDLYMRMLNATKITREQNKPVIRLIELAIGIKTKTPKSQIKSATKRTWNVAGP